MPKLPKANFVATAMATSITVTTLAGLATTATVDPGQCSMKADQIMLLSNRHCRVCFYPGKKSELVD